MLFYIIKVHILLLISYLIYRFLLKRNNNYHLNRFYLLFSLLLSVIAPLLLRRQLPNLLNKQELATKISPDLQSVMNLSIEPISRFESLLASYSFINLYCFIAFILLMISTFKIAKLFSYCKRLRNSALKFEGNIFYVAKDIRPFSFMQHVYISYALINDPLSLNIVKKHEQAHVNQLHSWDLMITEIINSLFFLNIFQVQLRKSIQENHEYLADQDALKGITVGQYIRVMIENTVQGLYPKYVNHFSKPLIFKRLAMLKQKSRTNYFSVLFSLTLFTISVLVISCSSDSELEEIKVMPVNTTEQKTIDNDQLFTIVEEQAVPKDGLQAFIDYVGAQLAGNYPEKAYKMGIEGVVYIQFVIEKDGTITNVEPVKGIGGGCDELAVEILRNSEAWIPGKQMGKVVRSVRIIPIRFQL